MRHPLLFIILFGLAINGPRCYSQSDADISNTFVELHGKFVHITYDILNTTEDASFEVWVEIKGPGGSNLGAQTYSGDIGKGIEAGRGKLIVWNPEADDIFLNALIDVQVYANMILPPPVEPATENAPAEEDQEEKLQQDQPATVTEQTYSENASSEKNFNRTSIILQSLAFPGLGLTRLKGKPHWIKGLVGYGCIAGSFVYNKKAVTSYNDYGLADSSEEANSLYSTTKTQDNISQGLAFAALAVWVTDLTWTIIGSSDLKKTTLSSHSRPVSIGTNYDMISSAPLLSFRYSF